MTTNVYTPPLRLTPADTEDAVKVSKDAVHLSEGNAFTDKLAKPFAKIDTVKGVKAFPTELCVCTRKALLLGLFNFDRSSDLVLENAFTAFTSLESNYVSRCFSVKAFHRGPSPCCHVLHSEVRHGL